ncbi:helix-turn-helix domain-containing protein [Stenotrophomonas sp. HITSZ_GD]|uniref:helix-turn-helix domain-containing protein n=1 Tax=Stenotrophomonas sp. HITSZ_GD TaxID=3037248 RepID=UPI00240E7642|nr:helix-turn-helix domain-containing protein [Stenotrophomonas sp. HITSZ_GD]MDG2524624.1 helix-turn-helix domain-containing protein [Stenotrophomonas sp. HITSZ_GD]
MSVEAITWALKQPIRQSSTKFVLVVLANCASGDSWLAFPSTAYLAEATGQDRKTVVSNLAKLREWGLIEDSGKRQGDTRQVIVYRLRGPDFMWSDDGGKGGEKRNSSENGTVPKTEANSTVFPAKQSRFSREESQKRDTEPSLTVRNRKEPSSAHARDDDGRLSPDAIERELAGLPRIPANLDREVLASFVRHRRVGRRTWSISSWLELLPRFAELEAQGHDLNESLRQTIRAGLHLPVTPTSSTSTHGNHHGESLADRAARQHDHQRRESADGPSRGAGVGRGGHAGELAGDVVDVEWRAVGTTP